MILTGTKGRRLGATAGELAALPYGHLWNPDVLPIHEEARRAAVESPFAGPLLPPITDASWVDGPRRGSLENGYSFVDGALHVAERTAMPGVTPAMVDWWFGWHSDEPTRYKLWHPRAHVHAEWLSPPARPGGVGRHIGHTSIVDEYLGAELGRFAIRFVDPTDLGYPTRGLDDEVLVCARVGFAEVPLDAGWLIHQVRRVPGGSEMRSRFWLGGANGGLRGGGVLSHLLSPIGRALKQPTARDGHNLLVHCAQEMAHLATFLPAIHASESGA
jgi:hypothetical protein